MLFLRAPLKPYEHRKVGSEEEKMILGQFNSPKVGVTFKIDGEMEKKIIIRDKEDRCSRGKNSRHCIRKT